MNPDPLAQLRDIHLPEPIGWWPPAPGWWLLALVFLSALIYVALWWRQRRARLYFRRQAQHLLEACWRDYEQSGEDRVFLNVLLEILKRARLSASHRPPHRDRGPCPDSRSQSDGQGGGILSSAAMLEWLEHSSRGKLGRRIDPSRIEQLLYRPAAEALSLQQCQALYQAARRCLKQVHRPC